VAAVVPPSRAPPPPSVPATSPPRARPEQEPAAVAHAPGSCRPGRDAVPADWGEQPLLQIPGSW
jgi:hypothetical protein